MAPVKTVFQLDHKPTWFENIAVRANGTLLVTRLDVPELMEVDPVTGSGKTIATIPGSKSLTGINELTPDVFTVGAGDYDLASGTVIGSYCLWLVDLTGAEPSLRQVTEKMPGVGLLNGTTTWDETTVLAADSASGQLFKIDVTSGKYTVCLSGEHLLPAEGAPMPLGINGVKIHDGYVYFTNTTRATFYRVPVDADAKPTGEIEVQATGFPQDDCYVMDDGTAYVVTHVTNMVMKVSPKGEAISIAGGFKSMDVAGCTACAVGRTPEDKNVLYVCTGGGNSLPVDGQTEPAKVVAIELDS
jgi:hypothetical protein